MIGVGCLLLLPACIRDNEPSGPPYYAFTAADRSWLQHHVGDEWVFANAAGVRQTFRVMQVEEEKKTRIHFPFGPTSQVGYYYDYWEARLGLLDSIGVASQLGPSMTLRFRTRSDPAASNQIPAPAKGAILSGGGDYLNFRQDCLLGGEDGFYHNFALQTNPAAFRNYATGFRTYTDVQALVAQANVPYSFNCFRVYPPKVQAFYYSRQFGPVQIITITGEVWSRIP